jgi:hypothetical protein
LRDGVKRDPGKSGIMELKSAVVNDLGAPDLIIRRAVPTTRPKLAVQMEPNAVCLVIDCSTSML